jgi:tRNA(Ile)-lysidine synthase
MQTNFVYTVYQIYKQNYVDKNKLIAVSSGTDSIVLLLVINSIQLLLNQSINLIHCNHFYQKFNFYFVKEVFKITFLLNSTLIISSPIYQSVSETNNRTWRQRIFKRGLILQQIEDIFLAHTQSDQTETFLFNLMRGTTLTGCTNFNKYGIKFESNFFKQSNLQTKLILNKKTRFIYNRPLIFLSRIQIKNLSKINILPYSIDSSNLNITFSRNKIRLIVLPVLKIYFNQNIEKQFEKFILQAENDSKYFEFITNKLVKNLSSNKYLLPNEFKKFPKTFQYKLLNKLIKIYCGKDINYNLTNKLVKKI